MRKSQSINDPTICLICTDRYSYKKKPMVLVCGHTFCEICLYTVYKNDKEVTCSFCKVISRLDNFDDMIVNYSVLNMVEFLESSQKEEDENQLNISNETKSLNKSGVNLNESNIYSNTCFHFPSKMKKMSANEINKLLICPKCLELKCILCANTPTSCVLNFDDEMEYKNEKSLKEPSEPKHPNLKVYSEFVDENFKVLNKVSKNFYPEIISEMKKVSSKIKKEDFDDIVQVAKERVSQNYKLLKSLIDKQEDAVLKIIDSRLIENQDYLEYLIKEQKGVQYESQRYKGIIEELSNYNVMSNKQKLRLNNIYNIPSLILEIRKFNEDVIKRLEFLKVKPLENNLIEEFNLNIQNLLFYSENLINQLTEANKKLQDTEE